MCTNQHWIRNKYTGQRLYVKCGRCESCLQEKAMMRATKIKNNYDKRDLIMFVTLTYDRLSCPYINLSDAKDFADGKIETLNVYRAYSVRKVRKVQKDNPYGLAYKRTFTPHLLGSVDFICKMSLDNVQFLKKFGARIGVSWYPDFQHFVARLRINLKRKYNFDGQLKIYNCTEYGERTQRPHMHPLIYAKGINYTSLRNAIIESWPFSNLAKRDKSIQLARNPASYLASYVNSGSDFSNFLRKYFKPKWSYSKGFGLAPTSFSAKEIYERYLRGDLSYGVGRDRNGFIETQFVPIPKYVIHRFFPLFKGYSRLAPSERTSYMRGVADIRRFRRECEITDEDIYKTQVRLKNAYHRFASESGLDLDYWSYCDLYQQVWNCHRSTCYRLFAQDLTIPINQKYNNLLEAKTKYLDVVGLDWNDVYEFDPNEFGVVKRKTTDMTRLYYDMDKTRKVTNTILSRKDLEF